ncbi:AHH domain-containing protein [Saccharospirillum salsuginis]|uniref:Uncharacterized protein n=1 Tax=Saccharospirillum salsuginis TaxID=418750 RepID=A0A918KRA9_9GAMM|nr:AHH domain-containing protein [Saccharospirillum salsuginis]GGX73030.1 hypothetical protein GCM10007392_45560 [Saccharospirillum salsuginis]
MTVLDKITGTDEKDSQYRKRLERAVQSEQDHPIHHGITMQAHHLLSQEGIKYSKLGDELKHRGYDMNVVENLVFLPSELIGACHLGVQLHRGNHTNVSKFTGRSYHNEVKYQIQEIETKIFTCKRNPMQTKEYVCDEMDKKSRKMLKLIAEFKMPLTHIDEAFGLDEQVGCGNQNTLDDHRERATTCQYRRDHTNHRDPKGNTITFPKQYYVLKVGQ